MSRKNNVNVHNQIRVRTSQRQKSRIALLIVVGNHHWNSQLKRTELRMALALGIKGEGVTGKSTALWITVKKPWLHFQHQVGPQREVREMLLEKRMRRMQLLLHYHNVWTNSKAN
jgi:hypothetical protein